MNYVMKRKVDLMLMFMVGKISSFHSLLSFVFIIFFHRERSFSCGRVFEYVETVLRLAAKSGSSFHIEMSGGYVPPCNNSTDPIPYNSEDWNPSQVPTLTKWKPTHSEVLKIKKKMIEVNSFTSLSDK